MFNSDGSIGGENTTGAHYVKDGHVNYDLDEDEELK